MIDEKTIDKILFIHNDILIRSPNGLKIPEHNTKTKQKLKEKGIMKPTLKDLKEAYEKVSDKAPVVSEGVIGVECEHNNVSKQLVCDDCGDVFDKDKQADKDMADAKEVADVIKQECKHDGLWAWRKTVKEGVFFQCGKCGAKKFEGKDTKEKQEPTALEKIPEIVAGGTCDRVAREAINEIIDAIKELQEKL